MYQRVMYQRVMYRTGDGPDAGAFPHRSMQGPPPHRAGAHLVILSQPIVATIRHLTARP